MAPGNLPAMRQHLPIRCRIYTTEEDAARIRACTILSRLARVAHVEFDVQLLPELLQRHANRYQVMNLCFAEAIKDANRDDAGWVWVHPDVLYADGSFASVARAALSGKRLFLAPPGLRTHRQLIAPRLTTPYGSENGQVLSIPPRDLVDLSMECVTPFNRSFGFRRSPGRR